MAENNDPKYATEIETWHNQVTNPGAATVGGPNTNYNTILTAPTITSGKNGGGVLVDSIIISSTDTTNRNLILARMSATTIRHIGVVPLPANSGSNGTVVSVDPLDGSFIKGLPINNQGKRYIRLKPGESLVWGLLAAATGIVSVSASGQRMLENTPY